MPVFAIFMGLVLITLVKFYLNKSSWIVYTVYLLVGGGLYYYWAFYFNNLSFLLLFAFHYATIFYALANGNKRKPAERGDISYLQRNLDKSEILKMPDETI